MRKFLILFFITATLGTLNVRDTSVTQTTESHEVSADALPENLRYDSEHADVIYVKDYGVFEKVDANIAEYDGEVICDDLQKVTDKTNIIAVYDAIYVKKSEWKS